MRNTFINTIIDECRRRDDIFIISGDAGLGVFDEFQVEFPDRFLNMGVAEQNMISFAAGLALTGYKVVLYNIIPFLMYRCYEQVRNDICYQELPIILVGIGSGVTYAPMGMTHYSIEDIGVAQTMSNLTVISPIDPVEAKLAARHALDSQVPVYVRLAKRGEPDIHQHADFEITRPQTLKAGEKVALLCHGSITEEVLKAHALLASQGAHPMVVSVPVVQPLDREALLQLFAGLETVVCVEEHYANSGLGSILSNLITENGLGCRLIKMGIPSGFIHEVQDTQGMRKMFGIDAESIAATTIKLFARNAHGKAPECNHLPAQEYC
jgi:transketolase